MRRRRRKCGEELGKKRHSRLQSEMNLEMILKKGKEMRKKNPESAIG